MWSNYKINSVCGVKTLLISFNSGQFDVEIFAQDVPVVEQNAYKHMIIEHIILQKEGIVFKEKIIALKTQGFKTEPAFAFLLDLPGNPYEAMLSAQLYEHFTS